MLSLYWKRFKSNPLALSGVLILLVLIFLALLARKISPFDPLQQNLLDRLHPPSSSHWFGTDELGRDVFSRILIGIRTSLWIGVIATVVSLSIGTTFGLVSGYGGGKWDAVIMRFVDLML